MKCEICNREIEGTTHGWYNYCLDIEDYENICEECNLSVNEQIYEIYLEMKKHE